MNQLLAWVYDGIGGFSSVVRADDPCLRRVVRVRV